MFVPSTSGELAECMEGPFHEIIEFYRCDVEISTGTTPVEEFANFLNYDQDWVSAVKPAVEYNGFDTDSIMSQLVRNRDTYLARAPDEVKYQPRKEGGLCYSNLGSFQLDMLVLVLGGLTRNSKINYLISKARGPGKDLFKMLKEKYVITDDPSSLDLSVITLPKIVRVHPIICAFLFNKKVAKEIVPYDSFPGTIKPATHSICCPLLQSCCPFILKGNNNFHPVMLWVQIKLDDIIHSQDGNTTSLSQILSYYLAAYQSNAISEARRINFFLLVGITTQEETSSGPTWRLTESSAILAANCLSELKNMRKDDEKHAALMKLASTGEF